MKYMDVVPPSFSNPDGLNLYPTTVTDEYLCGEIVRLWSARQHSKHLIGIYNSEMQDTDSTLAELFFRQKRKLCRLGRCGGWHQWLKQNRISRSVADRLALEFAEYHGISDEMEHRTAVDPIEGGISQRARRVADRLTKSLPSPRSRMAFLQVLADLLNLQADWEGGAIRLSIPALEDDEKWNHVVVPPVMFIAEDGIPRPVDYELKDAKSGDSQL